jgi:hypothetical protein
MDARWYAQNNPFKREPPRHTALKRTVAIVVLLGLAFVISGLVHADDTRGSAQPSTGYFAMQNSSRATGTEPSGE